MTKYIPIVACFTNVPFAESDVLYEPAKHNRKPFYTNHQTASTARINSTNVYDHYFCQGS